MGHRIVIARVTPVELASSLGRARRAGRIDGREQRRLWRVFLDHVARRYETIDLSEEIVASAADLAFRHAVRAYDAVQIATASNIRARLGASVRLTFVTADQTQAAIAGL